MSKTKQRFEELRGMNEADLTTAVESARRNVYTIIRQRISKPVENVKAIKANRKEIARILTIQRQREIEAAGGKTGKK